MSYLPRLVTLPGTDRQIPAVGLSGATAMTAWEEDVPLSAAYAEVAETYPYGGE